MVINVGKAFPNFGSALLVLIVFALFTIVPNASAATCPPGPTDPSVTVCTPTQNLIVPNPTHVVASTTDSQHKVTALQIYVDNVLTTKVNANTIDTYINLAVGNHLVTVQAWDDSGATFKKNVNVSMSPPCKLSALNQSITICTPGGGVKVSSPVHLVAGTTGSNPVQTMQILENGVSIYQAKSQTLDVYLTNLAAGTHNLTITAQDQSGVSFSKPLSVRVVSTSGMTKLKHIIYYVQENRSFDNYFGMLGQYRVSKGLPNSIDGLALSATLYNTQGKAVHPFHFQTVCHENLSPYWNESHRDWNGGKMDGFMKTSTSVPSSIDPTGTRAMGYYDQTDLPYYYELATQFATSDRFFSPVMTNTNANRMYLFAGTSFGHIFPDTPPSGGWTQPTIFDMLDAANVSWRYYNQDPGGAYLFEWSTFQRDSSKIVPISQWPNDLQNEAALPSVIFIERAGASGR